MCVRYTIKVFHVTATHKRGKFATSLCGKVVLVKPVICCSGIVLGDLYRFFYNNKKTTTILSTCTLVLNTRPVPAIVDCMAVMKNNEVHS